MKWRSKHNGSDPTTAQTQHHTPESRLAQQAPVRRMHASDSKHSGKQLVPGCISYTAESGYTVQRSAQRSLVLGLSC